MSAQLTPQPRGPVFTVPYWAKAAMVLIAIAVGIVVLYRLSETDFRLKVEEHQQIQTILGTIVAMVATMLFIRSAGTSLKVALVWTVVAGVGVVPVFRYLVRFTPLSTRSPRVRALAGAFILLATLVWLPSLATGRATILAGAVSNWIGLLAMFQLVLLGHEILEPDDSQQGQATD